MSTRGERLQSNQCALQYTPVTQGVCSSKNTRTGELRRHASGIARLPARSQRHEHQTSSEVIENAHAVHKPTWSKATHEEQSIVKGNRRVIMWASHQRQGAYKARTVTSIERRERSAPTLAQRIQSCCAV